MPFRFQFEFDILNSVAGGHSAIDIPKLNVQSLEEAQSFLESYGFDVRNLDDQEKLWYYHRRSLVFMHERLGLDLGQIPEIFKDRKTLGDIRYLLIWASQGQKDRTEIQQWACAFLRCMHVFVHAENDLFGTFSEEIQSQILGPLQKSIFHEGSKTFLRSLQQSSTRVPRVESLELVSFSIKPFKTSSSTVIKLLAKPDALAMKIFDKIGVRFVTRNLFDSFQLIRFMVEENLMSFPHIMPDQSSNNLYPVSLFMDVCSEILSRGEVPREEEIHKTFLERLAKSTGDAGFFRKDNPSSSVDFKFIKFITRKLIRVPLRPHGGEDKIFSFFYPYEVQIMDADAEAKMNSGPTEHVVYKERQKESARKRLFPRGLG